MKKKTVWYTDDCEIDKLVNDNFPQMKDKYECSAYEEYGNDEAHTFNVDAESKINDWDIKDIKNGEFHFKLHFFLNELARRGKLPFTKGELVLEISY